MREKYIDKIDLQIKDGFKFIMSLAYLFGFIFVAGGYPLGHNFAMGIIATIFFIATILFFYMSLEEKKYKIKVYA